MILEACVRRGYWNIYIRAVGLFTARERIENEKYV